MMTPATKPDHPVATAIILAVACAIGVGSFISGWRSGDFGWHRAPDDRWSESIIAAG